MFEIIIIIVVCVTIYRKLQNSKGGMGKGGSSLPNTTVTTANQGRTGGGVTGADNTGTHGQLQHRVYEQSSSAREAIREAREDGNDTTAYLMEKAEADAREHQREKYEEQKRLYETRGGLAVAERYLDGDSIPQGKRCVNCGYCGAQNLIPMVPRTRYSCYFCREPLNGR